MKYLGIDLGGTNVAAAVVDAEGSILGRASLPTPRGAEAVADQMAAASRAAAEAAELSLDDIASVGIGSPGAIDPEAGVVKFWSNLDFRDVPLVEMMARRLGREIYLENDANAAALGEYAAGAGKGSRSLLLITLGTGVGSGVVLNGKLYTGFNYAGMEAGHMVIEHGGRPCTCGRRGCFEAYSPPPPSSSAPGRSCRRIPTPCCGSWPGAWRRSTAAPPLTPPPRGTPPPAG